MLLREVLACPLLGVCLAGLTVRLTVRDRVPWLATFHYMTPLILLGIGCLLAAWWLRSRRRLAKVTAVTGLICLGWWWQSCCFARANPAEPDAMRVLFWNTARGHAGWEKIADVINRHEADLVGLVEAGEQDAAHCAFWQRRFVGRQVVFFGNEMLLATTGRVLNVRRGTLGAYGVYGIAEVRWQEREVTVLVVDVTSSLRASREEPLTELARLIAPLADRPVIVMGDFNTPTDSVFFDPLRTLFSNVFEQSGRGVSATWPVPLPVLAIDQIWISGRLVTCSATHYATWCSDHRAVGTELVWRPERPGVAIPPRSRVKTQTVRVPTAP